MPGAQGIRIAVEQGDAATATGDVLALKHAQGLHGVDLAVAEALRDAGIELTNRLPRLGAHYLAPSCRALGARHVLFVGTRSLASFDYHDIRDFSRSILTTLAGDLPDARHLLLTAHGIHLGLDETEAFESEIAGLLDALAGGHFPAGLDHITVVELNARRAARLQAILARSYPDGILPVPGRPAARTLATVPIDRFREAGYQSEAKPHVFVAMPFSDKMEDVFHYGIKNAANAAGFLCERADYSTFVGDILTWIKQRIATASLVVADLTGANPNVYLEVGYAWALDRPTVLLVQDPSELKFDVQGQRCIVYKQIKELEQKLARELASLGARH